MKEPDDRDISVIVQGPIEEGTTEKCLSSIRSMMPRAELILSTWRTDELKRHPLADLTIFNEDPGCSPLGPGRGPNNVNRQIVSTAAGLKASSRHYALKIRTDCTLNGTGFKGAFGTYGKRSKNRVIFSEKIVATAYACRLESAKRPFLFHPSDISLFGLRQDLITLFDIPIADATEMNWSSSNNIRKNWNPKKNQNYYCRTTPEQYIFTSALKKIGVFIPLSHPNECNEALLIESILWFTNNYIPLNEDVFGLAHTKNKLIDQVYTDSATCHSQRTYDFIYKAAFDEEFRISPRDLIPGIFALACSSAESPAKHYRRMMAYLHKESRANKKVLEESIATVASACSSVALLPYNATLAAARYYGLKKRVKNETSHC